MYMYTYIHACYIYIYIYVYGSTRALPARARGARPSADSEVHGRLKTITPGLHNKIPAPKIFARGWGAQICLFHW